jgi:hypothetical protein
MLTRLVATLAIGLSGVVVSNIPSQADEPVPISQLLEAGYQVKAAYGVQRLEGSTADTLRAGGIFDFIILQKGESAFRCENIGAKFNNQFHCYSVLDYEPND